MTAPQHDGRLELTWTNKHRRLLSHEDGSYEWTDPGDHRVAEVRLLHDVTTVGDTHGKRDRAKDNLLIRGDALHALTSLTKLPEFRDDYVGNVKLCYIDPPFNTGQAFPGFYDDALEHSVWLTMMRDRLVHLHQLMAPDASVWVHLDDEEMAYGRVLLDEVFGRENFIATVIWEKADSPRNSAKFFSTDHDYLLVYAKDAEVWRPHRLARTAESDAIYSNPDDDENGAWLPGDPYANKPYTKGLYEVVGPTGRTFKPPPGRYWRISQDRFDELRSTGRIWWGPDGSARPSIKRYLSEVADLVPRTLWRRDEVGSNRTSKNEIRALFPGVEAFATPKPEALMQRILHIATAPGDLVLDCFAGSGTTAAVAHKMSRRWAAVERSRETTETFTLPRLTKVVDGEDAGGVTTASEWKGGGGFRVLDVAPSMFGVHDARVVLADWAVGGALGEAVAAQVGFIYSPDPPFTGTKGRTRLAVVDGLVDDAVVTMLANWLPDGELLTVYGTAVDPESAATLRSIRRGCTVRKIPQSVLDEYRRRGRSDGLNWPSTAPRNGNAEHGAPMPAVTP